MSESTRLERFWSKQGCLCSWRIWNWDERVGAVQTGEKAPKATFDDCSGKSKIIAKAKSCRTIPRLSYLQCWQWPCWKEWIKSTLFIIQSLELMRAWVVDTGLVPQVDKKKSSRRRRILLLSDLKTKVEGGDDPEGNDPWGILTPSRNRLECYICHILPWKGEIRSQWLVWALAGRWSPAGGRWRCWTPRSRRPSPWRWRGTPSRRPSPWRWLATTSNMRSQPSHSPRSRWSAQRTQDRCDRYIEPYHMKVRKSSVVVFWWNIDSTNL